MATTEPPLRPRNNRTIPRISPFLRWTRPHWNRAERGHQDASWEELLPEDLERHIQMNRNRLVDYATMSAENVLSAEARVTSVKPLSSEKRQHRRPNGHIQFQERLGKSDTESEPVGDFRSRRTGNNNSNSNSNSNSNTTVNPKTKSASNSER